MSLQPHPGSPAHQTSRPASHTHDDHREFQPHVVQHESHPEEEEQFDVGDHSMLMEVDDPDVALVQLRQLREQHEARLRRVEDAYVHATGHLPVRYRSPDRALDESGAFVHPNMEDEDIAAVLGDLDEGPQLDVPRIASLLNARSESTVVSTAQSNEFLSQRLRQKSKKPKKISPKAAGSQPNVTSNEVSNDQEACAVQAERDASAVEPEEDGSVSARSSVSFTLADPFSFDKNSTKTRSLKESISKRRFMEEIEKRKKEEEDMLRKKFHANPVPSHIFQARFKEIQDKYAAHQNEWRRREHERQQRTLEELKKEREEQAKKEAREAREQALKNAFKANPMPAWITQSSWEQQVLEEQKRKERIADAARQLLAEVALPPRMQEFEEKMKEKAQKQKEKKPDEHRVVVRSVPDFSKLHATLPRTQVESTEHYIEFRKRTIEKKRKPKKSEAVGSVAEKPLNYQPKSTKTVQLRAEQLVHLKEEEEKRRLEKEKEEEERKVRNDMMRSLVAPLVRTSKESEEDERRRRRTAFLQALHSTEDQYKSSVDEMYQRVAKRPFLFEQVSQNAARIRAEEIALKTLEEAGLDLDDEQLKVVDTAH